MSPRPATIVTTEHIQRAYAQLRRPDWPPLDEMERWARQMAVVSARACALAHGHPTPAEPIATAPPAPLSPRALGHTERRRRRDDAASGLDFKSRAAGEKQEA